MGRTCLARKNGKMLNKITSLVPDRRDLWEDRRYVGVTVCVYQGPSLIEIENPKGMAVDREQ